MFDSINIRITMPGRSHYFHISKKNEKRYIDRLCAVFAVLMPLTTLPQIIMLYGAKDATGLSLLMWLLYTVATVPFLLFGIIHKHKQLIVLNSLWILVNSTMIIGILVY